MTISTWLMILALTVGPGTSQLIGSDSSAHEEPESNCWVNGVWYNPCPSGGATPWDPEPPPDTVPPT